MAPHDAFHEAHAWKQPIRELGLRLEGTQLEPLIDALRRELDAAGLARVRPRFYLSTEWGVPSETVAVAIPFYLASDELTRLHERQAGHVEGRDREDILRYLRHEVGHVVNYAYRLHEEPEWERLFGRMSAPYRENWRPAPFSRRHVRHLPGWYAQKHPEEDWAETFAVWLTPGLAWRDQYAEWPDALRKLEYCDAAMRRLRDVDPVVTDDTLDEDVAEVASSLEEFYAELSRDALEPPRGFDVALRGVFEHLPGGGGPRLPAADLVARLRGTLQADVYRWTGHFPERTDRLLAHVAERSRVLGLEYEQSRETEAAVALTALITALAMTWVARGAYSP